MSYKIFAETERLVMRELLPTDAAEMYEMDSDPDVHKYLGNDPVKNMDRVDYAIAHIRSQYVDNGIGRWAVIDKETNRFVGWSGLKLYKNMVANGRTGFYELGYRFAKKYWGKGYATETAKTALAYGFEQLKVPVIYAITDVGNDGSRHVLEKCGFSFIEIFEYEGAPSTWYELKREDWKM